MRSSTKLGTSEKICGLKITSFARPIVWNVVVFSRKRLHLLAPEMSSPSSFMLAAELRSFLAFPVAGVELHSRKTDRCRQELQCLSDDSRLFSVVLTINLCRYVYYILIYGIVWKLNHTNRCALCMSILDLTSSRGARSRSRSGLSETVWISECEKEGGWGWKDESPFFVAPRAVPINSPLHFHRLSSFHPSEFEWTDIYLHVKEGRVLMGIRST